MGPLLRFHPFPRMWNVQAPDPSGRDAVLRIGDRQVPLSAVLRAELEPVATRDDAGLMLAGTLSVALGLYLFAGVAFFHWDMKTMIGAVFLIGLGAASLGEAARATTLNFVRLRIETNDGAVVFTTADEADARALRQALERRDRAA